MQLNMAVPFVIVLSFNTLNASAQSDHHALRISQENACDTILAFPQLQQLTPHTVLVKGHDGQPATYTGAFLMDVLRAGCPNAATAEQRDRIAWAVRIDAWDAYHAVIALMEADTAFREHPVLLAWMRNGSHLDEHEGPLQVIIPDDLKHARDVRQVKQLRVVPL